jgi:hypothetical protein
MDTQTQNDPRQWLAGVIACAIVAILIFAL